jgi:hypothetical protein
MIFRIANALFSERATSPLQPKIRPNRKAVPFILNPSTERFGRSLARAVRAVNGPDRPAGRRSGGDSARPYSPNSAYHQRGHVDGNIWVAAQWRQIYRFLSIAQYRTWATILSICVDRDCSFQFMVPLLTEGQHLDIVGGESRLGHAPSTAIAGDLRELAPDYLQSRLLDGLRRRHASRRASALPGTRTLIAPIAISIVVQRRSRAALFARCAILHRYHRQRRGEGSGLSPRLSHRVRC